MILPELARMLVYRCLLVQDGPTFIGYPQYQLSQIRDMAEDEDHNRMALLRCSQKIHAKSTPILYGQNKFYMYAYTEGINLFREAYSPTSSGDFMPVFPLYITRLITHSTIMVVEERDY